VALVPHAGYVYSGSTAGKLFGLLKENPPRRVVIMAPNHRIGLQSIALSRAAAFATPLGIVEADQVSATQLSENKSFEYNDRAHEEEHAVEIQLPLIQRTWPEATPRIVPMLVPHLNDALRSTAAAALAEVVDQDTLILVSTDFTHYGASYGYVPFTENLPAAIEKLDTGAILRILAADPKGLRQYGMDTGITMCGLEAAAVALEQGMEPGYEGALVGYSRSGDRDGDYSLSVSYASVLLCSGDGGVSHGQ
jgi:AmmeMemoRadiSam system protein B